MAVKNEFQTTVSRRKVTRPVTVSVKEERKAYYKKIAIILKKPEEVRSEEEKTLLSSCRELVKEITRRIETRQKLKERSKEIEDPPEVLTEKCHTLAEALRNSHHLVVYTGAGISTAAQIPDYRGSNGIWTLLQQGKDIGHHDLTKAEPTLAHMALFELHRVGILKYVVSQNCDGLHLRSGLPKRALSELHGNMYLEVCCDCKPIREYWRLFDVTERTARFSHRTMRRCYACCRPLVDTIVHFGETGKLKWPINWSGACQAAEKADVILCMGSSLKVLKRYRRLWRMDQPAKRRPKLYIVNLQWTPKDDQAVLKISGKCDEVMKKVMEYLELSIPVYSKDRDPIFGHFTPLHPAEKHTTSKSCLSVPQVTSTGNHTVSKEESNTTCILSGDIDFEGGNADTAVLPVKSVKNKHSQFLQSNCSINSAGEYSIKERREWKENIKHSPALNASVEIPVDDNSMKSADQNLYVAYEKMPLFYFSVESGNEIDDCRIICKEQVGELETNSPIEIVYEGVKLRLGEHLVGGDNWYKLSLSYCCTCHFDKISDKLLSAEAGHLSKSENTHSDLLEKGDFADKLHRILLNVNKMSVKQCDLVAFKNSSTTGNGNTSDRDNVCTCNQRPQADKIFQLVDRSLCKEVSSHYFKYILECGKQIVQDERTDCVNLKPLLSIKNDICDKGVSSNVHNSPHVAKLSSCHRQCHLHGGLPPEAKISSSKLDRVNECVCTVDNCLCNSSSYCSFHETDRELRLKTVSSNATNMYKSKLSRSQRKKRTRYTVLKTQHKVNRKVVENKLNFNKSHTKCVFCKFNFNSNICLFYRPSVPNFKNINKLSKDSKNEKILSVCECCQHTDDSSDTGEIESSDTLQDTQAPKAGSSFQSAEDYNETLTQKIVMTKKPSNPGWYGKGCRKLIKKKRR
ncbi:uncharacterized protein LOC126456762 isoform X1 [Schistocerca serialis cubense]|uniref:uncharacterized protein LOC126456762 isoform X1 n=2 Tax=Schistocerca serialis cubense TaxID=2023355 RepID=UPI00214E64B4|nr:uncharacterized protein LOC126456762 isoform X1 [Schistocerca serialis cubense]